MTGYHQFLVSKRRAASDIGRTVDPDRLHPSLFDFQQAITVWALRKGRAAIFADTGLGKTRMQIEWARLIGERTLILAPLSVARQTTREAANIDTEVRYVRHGDQVSGPGVWITNYEMADRFDPDLFDAVVLDESSILKNNLGATRSRLIRQWANTRHRLACTATPAPNDVTELTNHAEFLGHMSRSEMLAAYFVHDQDGWRLKGHAAEPMYRWMSTWAVALRRPSDAGYPDEGFELPPLRINAQPVNVDIIPDGQLFATELGGVGGRSRIRRHTLDARVETAARLASAPGQWIVWCGLNDEADQLARQVDGAVNVEGTQTVDEKTEKIEAFQDRQIRVLVTKPSICGFGLNLQNCHQMIFLGLSDSWESYYQAVRRCWRYGQTSPVDVHIVVSELETQIVDNIRRKEADAAIMVGQLVAAIGWRTPAEVA